MIRWVPLLLTTIGLFTLLVLNGILGMSQGVGMQSPSPTPTFCPVATPVPLWVEPVSSPTYLFTQDVVVFLGYGEKVTLESESGTFSVSGDFQDRCCPAVVRTDLLPNTIHHLKVSGKVKQEIDDTGCIYGGYTLSTRLDRYGNPLIIQQVMGFPKFLPVVFSMP